MDEARETMNDGQRKDGHMDGNREKLNKRQLAVMDDLFSGQLDEPAVLYKMNFYSY